MLDIKDFLAGMQVLKSYYITWAFDFSDRFQVMTWYEYLCRDMDYKKFIQVLNHYISKHDNPPTNPGDLLRSKIEYEIKAMIHNGEPEQS